MTVIAITYLPETMPRSHRGRMQGAALAIGLVGIPVMAFFARGVVPTGPDGWRFVFVFGAAGAAAVVLIARLPESPRWLLTHGRPDAAEAALTAIEEDVSKDAGPLPAPGAAPAEVTTERDPRVLFRGGLTRRTWMLLAAWIFQTLGFVAVIYGGAGYGWVFVYIAACWVVTALAIGLFGPATGDVALEDLQAAATTGDTAASSPGVIAHGA